MNRTPAIGLHPMHERPSAGDRLTVLMRDGSQIECRATMIVVGDRAGIVIYHKRKAIDESRAKGWWPSAAIRARATTPPDRR